ncbi:MAG: hypothetical protein WED09_05865 [Homoserinimonas sp.]
MLTYINTEWRASFVLAREQTDLGARSEFYSRVRGGDLVAVSRGVYVTRSVWAGLSVDSRYRARVKAVAALAGRRLVFSHQSAAALWRLPAVGQWPSQVHVTQDPSGGGRSSARVARHTVGIPADLQAIEGLTVTTLARTVVDCAKVLRFGPAVAMADSALRRTRHPLEGLPGTALTPDDLVREASALALRQSTAKVARVIDFADGAADRPGESLSRVSIYRAGIRKPRLQEELAGASGRRYVVDFWWPNFDVIGEFDGKDKYRNPVFLRGRTPEQALLDEKDREDDLRAAGHGMVRWGWSVAQSPQLLAAKLSRAGVH